MTRTERIYTAPHKPLAPALAGIVLMLIGIAVALAGIWLAVLGGSPYYVAAGIALALTGLLLLRRSTAALWVHALLLLSSLVWAVWEAGLDWWPLAARLDALVVIGVVLLLPWIAHPLGNGTRSGSVRRGGGLALGVALVASVVVAAASGFRDLHDLPGSFSPSLGSAGAQGDVSGGIPPGEWQQYGRTGFGQRYSPLDQITPANVVNLKPAWQFQTGDVRGRTGDPEETTYEVTPLKIGNRLYLCTPHQSVIALDATTGAQIWRYDTKVQGDLALQHLTCRGLSYQPPTDGPLASANAAAAGTMASTAAATTAASANGPATTAPSDCKAKLFMPTADGRLIALNPDSGTPCVTFGDGKGQIDLKANMPNSRPGSYYSTSPVAITSKLVIVGGTVLDNESTHEESGVVRAFDINTGALVWNWDSGNPDATAPIAPGATYTANSPNSWSISSVDEALGMVYLPMGNQPPDQWGGNRTPAVERFSSSVVALDLGTGKVRWVFQTVHHDLWDYDVPSQPSLVDLTIAGARVPALVQPTKQGEIFILDRRTGTPLLPVSEIPSPQAAAQGDHTAPTQPKSALSYEPPRLTGRDLWGATMFDQLACRIAFHRLRYEGRFTPPSEQGSLIFPGNFGVFNWGSVAVDPKRQIAFTTPTYLAFTSRLVPRPDDKKLMVQSDGPPKGALPAINENFGAPFAAKMGPFLSPLGIPCQAPPWGNVAGADLGSGKIVWEHRNGTVRDLSPLPLPFKMGVPNIGGPILTASGVAFLSGSLDYYVRAYDVNDGRQLWQSRLPAGGQATPMTYVGNDGRQYLLVVAGGHGSTGTKAGDYVMAYALPRP